MSDTNLNIEDLILLPPKEAIVQLSIYIETHPQDEEGFVERGRKHWALNHRKEAINDYLHALEINPQSRARMLLDYAYSILDFYNKDLLNP